MMIHASALRPSTVRLDAALREGCEDCPDLEPTIRLNDVLHGCHSTDESDRDALEREFVRAIEAYKISSGRMFPTWSEVLEVLIDLGYVKVDRYRERAC